MAIRLLVSVGTALFLMLLVVLEMSASDKGGMLTVEQLMESGKSGLSFDRHFAMPLDFCIFPGFIALAVFLCVPQWRGIDMVTAGIASVVLTEVLVWMWSRSPTPEAHKIPAVALLHGIYFGIALWAAIMVLVLTPRPEPVLLLSLCIVLPAFLFVGQHLYLGLINWVGSASTYPDRPLGNPIAWGMIAAVTVGTAARSYFLIPESFWDGLK